MKKLKMIFAALILCGIAWQACQKEESGLLYNDVETMQLKTGNESIKCTSDCIEPGTQEYFVAHIPLVIGWAGSDNNKFNKTVEVKYFNTLTDFVLKVRSTNGIADVLMDDESIKNFEGTIPPDTWQEITFPLADNWEACDTWEFELKIAGFGPPAYFDVEYQLIGECVYYTLDLTVYPEGAGTVSRAGEYKAGDEVELTATANEEIYEFKEWIDQHGNIVSTEATFTYIMPGEAMVLTANFEEVFVCGVSTVTDIDGNVYNTVLIGDQCWLAENLKTTHYMNGETITTPQVGSQWRTDRSGAYVWPRSEGQVYQVYGALYNWYAVNNESGLCPAGWHVASRDEWAEMIEFLGGYNEAGGKLKSTRTSPDEHPRWPLPNNGATNESGFEAFGAGVFSYAAVYANQFSVGFFWTSTAYSYYAAYRYHINTGSEIIYLDQHSKNCGRSVRCLKDD